MADVCSECGHVISDTLNYIEPRFYKHDWNPAPTDPVPLLCGACAKRILRDMSPIDRQRLGLPAWDLDVLREAAAKVGLG